LLQHDALIYDSDHEYLSSLVPFLLVGVKRSEAVLVVTTRKRIAMLREALGSDAAHVEFRNSAQFLRTPTGALTGFRRFVNRRFEDGAAWIRILAEPVWAGRTEVEVAQWMRLESLVNLTFASSPATFICPYDGRSVAEPILANARHTHPQIAEAGGVTPSSTYLEPEEFLLTGL
jgi:hypothetical protein